jgi:hypothetical protein
MRRDEETRPSLYLHLPRCIIGFVLSDGVGGASFLGRCSELGELDLDVQMCTVISTPTLAVAGQLLNMGHGHMKSRGEEMKIGHTSIEMEVT